MTSGVNKSIPSHLLLELYRVMLEIREVELKIEEHYHEDEMKTPIHPCIGQEAVAAGVCANLNKEDYVFSNHRGHGHYLAKKGDLNGMIAELYNRETGCARGRGGSMHLIDTSVGLLGSSAIVGGGIPLATGAALASKLRNQNNVSVVFFGDGAAEEGVLYESINFAVLKKLPVLYICENNLYSVCSPLSHRQPRQDIYKKAQGFSMPAYQVDGNDVVGVYQLVNEMVGRARKGEGPCFVECLTYRMRDHHGTKTGVQIGYQSQKEWEAWQGKCPINSFEQFLLQEGVLSAQHKEKILQGISRKVEAAFKFAKESPLPNKNELYRGLYQ